MGLNGIKDYQLRNILFLLWEHDISDQDLCNAIGINKSAVTDWRSGKTSSYKRHLTEIASYLKVSVIDLMNEQLIVDRLTTEEPSTATEEAKELNDRLNEFHSFPLSVQEVGLDVMRGIAKRNAAEK